MNGVCCSMPERRLNKDARSGLLVDGCLLSGYGFYPPSTCSMFAEATQISGEELQVTSCSGRGNLDSAPQVYGLSLPPKGGLPKDWLVVAPVSGLE